MTTEELDLFVESSCAAFPGLLELLKASPATVSVWGRTLDSVSYEEATSVLDRWIVGTLLDPPVGYRRETFALDVRAVVARDRADEARRKASVVRIHRGKYIPSAAFKSITEPFGRILELRARVMRGEMELDDCERQIHEIVEAF